MSSSASEVGYKDPQYIKSLSELKSGDSLLFRPPSTITKIQKIIIAAGNVSDIPHGHADTTHAAIVTEMKEGVPWIAHLTGHEIMGYKNEPLEDMINRDGGDRAFLVFRHENENIAQLIAALANDEKQHDRVITWSVREAMKIPFVSARLPSERIPHRKLSEDTENIAYAKPSFCSRFVTNVIKNAVNNLWDKNDSKKYQINIRSTSLPANLEDELYRNKYFMLGIYPGKENPYEYVKKIIEAEIVRLGEISKRIHIGINNYKKKHELLLTQYKGTTKILDKKMHIDDLARSRLLLKAIQDTLAINTGFGINMAASYRNVIMLAEIKGIFVRNVSGNQLIESSLEKFKQTSTLEDLVLIESDFDQCEPAMRCQTVLEDKKMESSVSNSSRTYTA